jgi:hypothetical protein
LVGLSDFTDMGELGVHIAGVPLDHRLYHFRLLRGTADFDDLATYHGFIEEIVSRRNARNAKRIDHERATLQALPDRRTSDYEEVIVKRRLHLAQGVLHRAFTTIVSMCSSAAPISSHCGPVLGCTHGSWMDRDRPCTRGRSVADHGAEFESGAAMRSTTVKALLRALEEAGVIWTMRMTADRARGCERRSDRRDAFEL